MMHEKDDVLKVANVLAKKVIEFSNRCKHDEFKDAEIRCYELSLIADIARQVTSDTGDIGEGC